MHHCVGCWLKTNWTKALYQQTAEALFPTTSRCHSSPQKVEKCRGRLEKAKDAVMPSIPAGQAKTWNREHAQTNRHCSPQAGSLKQNSLALKQLHCLHGRNLLHWLLTLAPHVQSIARLLYRQSMISTHAPLLRADFVLAHRCLGTLASKHSRKASTCQAHPGIGNEAAQVA
jgi:hypothetical protein